MAFGTDEARASLSVLSNGTQTNHIWLSCFNQLSEDQIGGLNNLGALGTDEVRASLSVLSPGTRADHICISCFNALK